MKRYIRSSIHLNDKQRSAVEEYLRKYCPEYLGHKNKEYLINQTVKSFESGDNPFRKYSSEYNDSMATVWESYRRKFMQIYVMDLQGV